MTETYAELIAYFFIYGFLGWVLEVIFHAIVQQKLVNRGFLNGAICPIYGLGMVILIVTLEPIKGSLVKLFIGAALLCTILELITGFLLKVIFKKRWWDYSKEKFNLGGYICLEFSIYWGVAGVIAIDGIHPLIRKLVNLIPDWGLLITVAVLGAILLFDIGATIISVRGLNKDLTHIDEIGDMIKSISDEITEMLYDGSIDAVGQLEKHMPEIEAKKVELEKWKSKADTTREKVADNMTRGQKRLVKAFPNIKNFKYEEHVEDVKKKYKDYKEKMEDNK